jgi:release factor glutamine methyltransferase
MQPTSLSKQKVRALIAEGEYELAAGPHPVSARRDAEVLLLYLFKRNDPQRNTAWLIAHWNNPTDHGAEFRALIKHRHAGEPIQYITGEQEFYGLPFHVTPDVLIPRPETEHLVEKALQLAANLKSSVTGHDFSRAESRAKQDWALAPAGFPRIVDIGTGSGAIAVALAHQLPNAQITALDISSFAINIARENAQRNGVADRIRFIQSDLLSAIADERFDMVVSNPPYVPQADRDSLSVEVREHEPALALFAGEDGLDIYRRLIPAGFAVLEPRGYILLEIGFGQSPAVAALLKQAGFVGIEFVPDFQGIPRVACGRRP